MSTTRQLAVGIDIQGPDAVIVVGQPKDGSARTQTVPLERVSGHIPSDSRVGVALPLRESVGRWLETPLTSTAKARKVLPTVLDIQLPFALEECEYGFVAERKGPDRKIQALAVAARHPAIESALAQWDALGVDPDVLDHEGLALWAQALAEVPVSRDAPSTVRAVVYAGVDRGCIALGRGRTFINSHTCVLEEPARLRRLLRAAFGESLPAIEWVWCGPRAEDPAYEGIRREIVALSPGPGTTVNAPTAFLARALCSRAISAGACLCNFRSGPYANARQAEASSRVLNRVAVGMLLVGLILWGSALVCRTLAARAVRTSQDHFFGLFYDVAATPANGVQGEHAVTLARRTFEARRDRTVELEPMLSPSLTQPLFGIIAATDPAALQIHECKLSATEWHLTGHADDRAAVKRLQSVAGDAGHDVTLQWGGSASDGDANDFVLTSRGGP